MSCQFYNNRTVSTIIRLPTMLNVTLNVFKSIFIYNTNLRKKSPAFIVYIYNITIEMLDLCRDR